MGYRAKTNRRGHIYAWGESLLERAWTRVNDEAAYFLVTSRSTNANRSSLRRSYATTIGWSSCGWLTRTAGKLSSVIAITIYRQTDRLIGPTRINLALICRIMRRRSEIRSAEMNRASLSLRFTCREETFLTF